MNHVVEERPAITVCTIKVTRSRCGLCYKKERNRVNLVVFTILNITIQIVTAIILHHIEQGSNFDVGSSFLGLSYIATKADA